MGGELLKGLFTGVWEEWRGTNRGGGHQEEKGGTPRPVAPGSTYLSKPEGEGTAEVSSMLRAGTPTLGGGTRSPCRDLVTPEGESWGTRRGTPKELELPFGGRAPWGTGFPR